MIVLRAVIGGRFFLHTRTKNEATAAFPLSSSQQTTTSFGAATSIEHQVLVFICSSPPLPFSVDRDDDAIMSQKPSSKSGSPKDVQDSSRVGKGKYWQQLSLFLFIIIYLLIPTRDPLFSIVVVIVKSS